MGAGSALSRTWIGGEGLQLFPLWLLASVSLTVEEGDMTILNSAAAGVELQVTLGCRLIGVDNWTQIILLSFLLLSQLLVEEA